MTTIDDIRTNNLHLLSSEYGGPGALAAAIGKHASQVSQWLNRSRHSVSGKPRAISGPSCRALEDRIGKAAGWMDVEHRSDGAPGPTAQSVYADFLSLPREERTEFFRLMASSIV